MLEDSWLGHAVRSSIAIKKYQLGCDIRKKSKRNVIIFQNFFKLSGLFIHAASFLLRNIASEFY